MYICTNMQIKREVNMPEKYENSAEILKALAHPTRLWMVNMLSKGELCVCEFARGVDAHFSTVSRHLAVLRQAGIIGSEKRGKNVFYHLKTPCVLSFTECIERIAAAEPDSESSAAENVESCETCSPKD